MSNIFVRISHKSKTRNVIDWWGSILHCLSSYTTNCMEDKSQKVSFVLVNSCTFFGSPFDSIESSFCKPQKQLCYYIRIQFTFFPMRLTLWSQVKSIIVWDGPRSKVVNVGASSCEMSVSIVYKAAGWPPVEGRFGSVLEIFSELAILVSELIFNLELIFDPLRRELLIVGLVLSFLSDTGEIRRHTYPYT